MNTKDTINELISKFDDIEIEKLGEIVSSDIYKEHALPHISRMTSKISDKIIAKLIKAGTSYIEFESELTKRKVISKNYIGLSRSGAFTLITAMFFGFRFGFRDSIYGTAWILGILLLYIPTNFYFSNLNKKRAVEVKEYLSKYSTVF